MTSKLMTGPMGEDPTPMQPRWPGTNLPAAEPLPAGATVDTLIELEERWTPDAALDTIGTIAKAEQFLSSANIIKPTGFDFQGTATRIAQFAAIGTAIGPGLGTIIGAAAGLVYSVVSWFVSRPPDPPTPIQEQFANSPEPVQHWVVAYAQQDFVDWAEQNGYNELGTIADVAKLQLVYWLNRYGWIICWSQARFYNNIPDAVMIDSAGGEDAVAELYRQNMADYWATKSARDAAGLLNVNQGYTINAVMKARVNLPGQDNVETPGGSTAVALIGLAAVAALLVANKNQ